MSVTTIDFGTVSPALSLGAGEEVDNSGAVVGAGAAVTLGAGGTLKDTATGTVTGGSLGVLEGAGGIVINAGMITGLTGDGIDDGADGSVGNFGGTIGNTGTISGQGIGVLDGAVGVVANSGLIEGIAADGVDIGANSTLTNNAGGTISGGVNGFGGGSAATVVNDGSLSGTTGDGISVGGASTVTNAGIVAGARGLYAGASSAVTNSGNITGSGLDGIDVGATASVSNSATGVVLGAAAGLSGGATVILANYGSIIGTAGDGTDLGATATVTNGGVIQGGVAGLMGGVTVILANTGTIAGAGGDGVDLSSSANVTNALGAVIRGSVSGLSAGATAGLDNEGSITGSTGDGVDLGATGVVTNSAGATISGGDNGLTDGATALVVNAGTISGTDGDALDVGATGNISNAVTGRIVGGATGITGGATATLVNDGVIDGTQGDGINVGVTGNITNASGATVTGGDTGVIDGAGATVLNTGSIQGLTGDGVDIAATGSVTNTLAGMIEGGVSGVTGGASDVVSNAGTIVGGTGDGLSFGATGILTNLATGKIKGAEGLLTGASANVTNFGTVVGTSGDGADLSLGGTLVNVGTIIGTNGTAAYLGGIGSNTVVVDPGSEFYGAIVGGTGSSNILELGTGYGLITDFPDNVVGFEDIVVDPGAHWVITGTVDIPTSDITLGTDSSVTFDGITLGTAGSGPAATQSATPGMESVPCLCKGTSVLTPGGGVLVEDLKIGDLVVNAAGAAKPIIWIGRRSYVGAEARDNARATPVWIREGALSPGVPARDLYVSPEHAMYLDEVLVPARELVNGTSILIAENINPICYFHIELAEHDVIFAEGAATETFVDRDSRCMFDNAAAFAEEAGGLRPSLMSCAPVVEEGQALVSIRRRLATRAAQIGATSQQDGPLNGNLELVDGLLVQGWAQLTDHPLAVAHLQIFDNDVLLGDVCAKDYRTDLMAAGIGRGRHGFRFQLAQPLDPFVRHQIDVRGGGHGASLDRSPRFIEPCLSIDPDAGGKIAAMFESILARARTSEETTLLLSLLGDATLRARAAQAVLEGSAAR